MIFSPLFKACDMRGVVDATATIEVVEGIGRAVAGEAKPRGPKIVVKRS